MTKWREDDEFDRDSNYDGRDDGHKRSKSPGWKQRLEESSQQNISSLFLNTDWEVNGDYLIFSATDKKRESHLRKLIHTADEAGIPFQISKDKNPDDSTYTMIAFRKADLQKCIPNWSYEFELSTRAKAANLLRAEASLMAQMDIPHRWTPSVLKDKKTGKPLCFFSCTDPNYAMRLMDLLSNADIQVIKIDGPEYSPRVVVREEDLITIGIHPNHQTPDQDGAVINPIHAANAIKARVWKNVKSKEATHSFLTVLEEEAGLLSKALETLRCPYEYNPIKDHKVTLVVDRQTMDSLIKKALNQQKDIGNSR